MNKPAAPDAFAQVLVAVQSIIEFTGNRGLIIGGVAVSLLAKPRFTADIDALLLYETADVAQLVEHAATMGLVPRTPIRLALPKKPRFADAARRFANQRRHIVWRDAVRGRSRRAFCVASNR